MKIFIQFLLFLTIIFSCLLFYNNYFNNQEETIQNIEIGLQSEIFKNDSGKQLIKNLKYEVNFVGKGNYSLVSELSDLSYENNIEIVTMQSVEAKFINLNGELLVITSKKALYNTNNYNTIFTENVKINYIDNIIRSEKLEIDFKKNLILIQNNIIYNGQDFRLKADNVKIDLITNKINISMNNPIKRIEIKKNK